MAKVIDMHPVKREMFTMEITFSMEERGLAEYALGRSVSWPKIHAQIVGIRAARGGEPVLASKKLVVDMLTEAIERIKELDT